METEPVLSYAEKAKKPPPITVCGANKWMAFRKAFHEKGIKVEKAKILGTDLRIFPKEADDYRKATRFFNETGEKFYTYSMNEVKVTYVVIKGLDIGTSIQDIKEDLYEAGLKDVNVSISRMTSRKTGKPMALFQVKTVDQEIYKINRLGGLVVKIEKKK